MTCGCRSREEPFAFNSKFNNEEESWPTGFPGNWQEEVSGKNSDRYVLWLQESLNKVVNLRAPLVEDGDFGTKTRNALWTFRRQARLRSSGDLICPDTERALIAAGANPPPAMVQARASETTPPALTIYEDIPLQIRLGNAKSMTGIFVPDGFCPLPEVDLIIYLHGFKVRVHKPEFSIAEYWKTPEFLLREEVNKTQKNVIFVAPTLGPQNQPGSLTCPGGFDNFLDQVRLALKQHGPYAGQQTPPSIGKIVLACHSGSGWVMRAIALGTDASASKVQECWAFEPANMGDANGWKKWARSRSQNKLFIYYLPGTSGQRLCAALMGRSVPKRGLVSCAPNIFAEQSSAGHDLVPRAYLKDRIQGAPFLLSKSSCRVNPSAQEWGWEGEVRRSFPQSVITMLKRGLVKAGLKLAVASGFRSETELTNLVFFMRHPERGGKAIARGEPNYAGLVRDWKAIRDRVVRPALRGSAGSKPRAPSYPYQSTPATPPTPSSSGLDIVSVRGINVARQIAQQVGGLLAAAEAQGIKLSGGGYRSRNAQIELRKRHCGTTQFDIFEKPSSLCTPPTAPPGRSQHETGLAIDFTYGGSTIKSQTSPAFKWLKANAARFGLYNLPSEPWHWSVNGK